MTTPTIEQIYRHYSVRKYKADPVPASFVECVVAAGQRASTSSNLQTYSVVAVIDQAKRERLAELCGNQAFIAQAPVFLAWCADQSRLARICQKRGYTPINEHVESFLVAVVDAALAMQNAAVAAESLGLGMCFIGGIRNHPQEVIDLLALHDLVFPVSGMTLGWPAAEPFIRPRLSVDAILHWDSYSTSGEEELLQAYDREMIETGIYDGRQVPVAGAEGELEDYSWQEHSARRTSKAVRAHLRQVIETQGFSLR